MQLECPAGGPEPNTMSSNASDQRKRLRKPQIGSKLPTLAAPLSVAALLSAHHHYSPWWAMGLATSCQQAETRSRTRTAQKNGCQWHESPPIGCILCRANMGDTSKHTYVSLQSERDAGTSCSRENCSKAVERMDCEHLQPTQGVLAEGALALYS